MSITKKEEIEYRGYDEVTSLIEPSRSLQETLTNLSHTKRVDTQYVVHKMSQKEAIKDTKIFYDSFFRLHKVLTTKNFRLFNHRYSLIKKANPLKLSIRYINDEDIFSGTVIERFLPANPPVISFSGIALSYPTNEHTSTSYAHEIMHTQVDSQIGCVTNYYDAEVLSIFIELVITYYLSKDEYLLNLEDSRRTLEMVICLETLLEYIKKYGSKISLENENVQIYDESKTISETDFGSTKLNVLENTKYLVSDLKAYSLFNIFYYGSESIKKEMLSTLQKVIDGELSLSDYLKKYDVSLESSQDSKRLIKYFTR